MTNKHQEVEVPKLCSLSFSLKPFFTFWLWGMAIDFLAEVLIYQLFSLLCGHPAAKGFLKGLIFFFFLVTFEWFASLETNSCQVNWIFFGMIRKYPWSLQPIAPASWKSLRSNADAYYFLKGIITLAIVVFECGISTAFHRPHAGLRKL